MAAPATHTIYKIEYMCVEGKLLYVCESDNISIFIYLFIFIYFRQNKTNNKKQYILIYMYFHLLIRIYV